LAPLTFGFSLGKLGLLCVSHTLKGAARVRGGLIYTKARLTKPLGDIAEGRNTLSIASFLLAATVLFVARITTKT